VLRFAGAGDDLSAVINAGLFVSALTSVIASLAFVAGASLWTPELTGPLSGLGAVLIFAIFNTASGVVTLLDAVAAGQRSAQQVALRRLLGVTKLPLLLPLAASGAVGIYTASLLPVVVGSVASVAALPWMVGGYRRTFTASAGTVRRFFTFSLETFPASLLSGAPPFILPLFALGILGPVKMAYFYIAWSVASVLMLIPNFVAQVSLSEASRGDSATVARRSRRFALGLVVPAVACVVVLAGPVLRLYGQEYGAHATHALQLLAVSAIPWAVVAIKLSALRAAGRAREVLLLSALFALGSLAAAGGLGTVLGLPGLAIGWTAGVSGAAVLSTQIGARSASGRRASQVDGQKAARVINGRHNDR
jgi:O-antigen/teichoic acid export membrane protein